MKTVIKPTISGPVSYINIVITDNYTFELDNPETFNIVVDFTYPFTLMYDMVKTILKDDIRIIKLSKIIIEHMFIEYNIARDNFDPMSLVASLEYDIMTSGDFTPDIINELDPLFKENKNIINEIFSFILNYYYTVDRYYDLFLFKWFYASLNNGCKIELRATSININYDIIF